MSLRAVSTSRLPALPGLVLLAALTACGNDPPGGSGDAGPSVRLARLTNAVAFEGQSRFVTELTATEGDLTGATVSVPEDAPLRLLEQRCVASRCGLLFEVLDGQANLGRPLPAPIDATQVRLQVEPADGGAPWQALLSVYPLDVLRNTSTSGEAVPVRTPMLMAARMELAAGASWRLEHEAPARWFVFGDARLGGSIDASAAGPAAGPGGGAGGEPGADATGPGGGAAGPAGQGGGGGGHAQMGESGADAGGGPGGQGGMAVGTPSVDCLGQPEQDRCGGGGGGGAAGSGGGGGGGLLLVVLGHLDAGGGRLLARGADGEGGGGGGAGGAIQVAAWSWTALEEIDVAGGAGGAGPGGEQGGAGSPGRLRADVPSSQRWAGAWAGPWTDPSALPAIVEAPTVRLSGQVEPGTGQVEVGRLGEETPLATADVAASGDFEIEVPLEVGLQRLWLRTDEGVRSWVGSSLELATVTPGQPPVPVGALLDVVRLR